MMRHNPLYIDLYEKSTGKQVHPKQVDNALRDALGHLGYPYDNDSWYLDWMTELSIKGADAASHLRGQSTGTLLIDVKGNGYYKNLDPTQTMTSEEKEAYDAYSQFYNDKADALDWITDHYSFNSGHAPRNNPRKKPVPSRGRKPARDNATFTGKDIKGDGNGPRELVEAFYAEIDARLPGNIVVPLPPVEQVDCTHSLAQQAFIMADHLTREIASTLGYVTAVHSLRRLPPIVDKSSARNASLLIMFVLDEMLDQVHINQIQTAPLHFQSKQNHYQVVVSNVEVLKDVKKALQSAVEGLWEETAKHTADAVCALSEQDRSSGINVWKRVKEMIKSL